MTELDKNLAKAARECSAVVLMVATSATLPLLGGVKYWDNPAFKAFDVGDYAPGAVWNYDGIRNQGADLPHSTTATTWKNIGSSGASNDLWIRYRNAAGSGWANSSAPASLGIVDGRNLGSWTDNGFVLTGDSEWRTGTGSINTGTDYTLQMVVDATVNGQVVNSPYFMSVNASLFAFYVNKGAGRLWWQTQSTSLDYHLSMSGNAFSYMTAIINSSDNTGRFFNGTTPPTSGDGFKQYNSVIGRNETGYCIGGNTSAGNCMAGAIHSYRYYKRVLTQEELVWNRVVDEARFFGRRAPIPATNVVVTANWPRVGGFQPNGHYYVDSGDFTITAPVSTNMYGRAYTCTGYTLETWDDVTGTWSAPVSSDSRTYTFTYPSAKVRLTWQWTAGDGLVTYDLDDYVWDGLLWFYDGIHNVGLNRPHDSTSLNWKNLGSAGAENDLFLQHLNGAKTDFVGATSLKPVGDVDPGAWTDTGFVFKGDSRFRSNGTFPQAPDRTVQLAIDVQTSTMRSDPSYLLSISSEYFNIRLGKTTGNAIWRLPNKDEMYCAHSSRHHNYITAILNGTAQTANFFSGTNAPTSGTGFLSFESMPLWGDTAYCVGAAGGGQPLFGTMKALRYYNRALSDEEVARNRVVDEFRYFGRSPVTNVLVATTCPYLQGNEKAAAYEVVGAYTFTAPASVTAKGIAYANDGYTVETWDGSAWADSSAHTGTSYAYTTAAGKVRLTWKWKPVRGVRTAADYSFDDYSQAGLAWNYDGIYNVGALLPHSTNTTTWFNIGSGGDAFNLAQTRMSDGDLGEWTADGYEFRGHTRFKSSAAVGPLKCFTCQALMDASADDQNGAYGYPMSVMYDYFALLLNKANGTLCWNSQGNGGGQTILSVRYDSHRYDYATMIFDYDAKSAAFFAGTEPPTSGDGFHQFSSVRSRSTGGYGLGCTATASDAFTGIVKMFRYYDRVLTQEEVVRNRNVDAVRYFGALGVTNVLVVAGESGVLAETACKVEGTWTFTATNTVNSRGETIAVKRYSVEELVNGAWTNKATHDGTSYTYTEGTDPATVRLTWLGPPSGTMMIFR